MHAPRATRRIPPPLPAVLALLFLLLCSGCAKMLLTPEMEYAAEGRHDKVIETIETEERQGAKISAIRYKTLCLSYYQTKDYERTLSCLDKLQAVIDQGDRSWLGLDQSHDAEDTRLAVFLDLGQYDTVIKGCDAILRQTRNENPRRNTALMLAGIAYGLKGDTAMARRYAEQFETANAGSSNLAAQFLDYALATIYLAVPDGPKAYEAMRRTTEDAQSSLLKGVVVLMTGNKDIWSGFDLQREFMLAKSALLAGKTAEARTRYDALLVNKLAALDGYIHWQLLNDRGAIALADKETDKAAGLFAQAVEIVESQRRTIGSEASKIGFVGNKQSVYRNMVDALLASGQAAKAFEYAERAKSRALVDLLAERQGFTAQAQAGQADPAQTLRQLASLEQKYVSQRASAAPEETARLRSALSGLRQDIRQKTPELASLVTVAAPKVTEIQAQLGPDQTLLEYYGSGDDLYAFTVTRASITATKLDGKGLEADVRSFRETLKAYNKDTYKPIAQALYGRLIAPVAGALDKPSLIIVSHGALHYLPFNALFDGQKFLVDKVAVQMLPSASVMQFLDARHPATARDMLLLGNPDLGDKAMDLPGAEAEARAIKGIWPNSTMLMRRAATKSALTNAGQLFKVIHVAAHGEFSSDQPLNSRLLLAPEGGDNGQLTAGDLYGMRLNADLVTLSACETGMGKVLSGDDVVGLTRGFLYAGANSIVASLWPVSDDETKFLMTSFYRNLKTMPKTGALRQAQLETKKKYPHPFFWSAFQLTGMGR